jgi:hypothetical protein
MWGAGAGAKFFLKLEIEPEQQKYRSAPQH